MKKRKESFGGGSFRIPNYILVGVLVIFLVLVIGFLIFYYQIILGFFGSEKINVDSCGDGTFYGECSKISPYYCDEGILVERASVCGCPSNFEMINESCFSDYSFGEKKIFLNYSFEGENKNISYTVYRRFSDYMARASRGISYEESQTPQRVDFKKKYIDDELQKQFLLPLVVEIQNLAKSKDDQARIAVSLVQNIPFGKSDRRVYIGENSVVDYSRYPYEVLYEGEGVCGEKSLLLSFLLRELGYGVAIFYFPDFNHEAVGVSCLGDSDFYDSGYCFVETSGPSIISDYDLSYSGGIKLGNNLEIMSLSEGISLSKNLEEYHDAEILSKARREGVNSDDLERVINYYGLVGEYSLG